SSIASDQRDTLDRHRNRTAIRRAQPGVRGAAARHDCIHSSGSNRHGWPGQCRENPPGYEWDEPASVKVPARWQSIRPDNSAYGYVLKTAPPERLALALRAVLAEGQILIDREVHSLNSFGHLGRESLNEV